MMFSVAPIGVIESPFSDKFGIPRQPELVPAAETVIVLNPEFGAESVRGLAEFGYIWVQFVFHDAIHEGWAQMVRPPRLGGKKKVGVFATRSPHRPNHLGLSLLKLRRVDDGTHPIRLICGGSDLLNGTPVLDIKPYIPFVEAKPDAASGFVNGAPPQLRVCWHEDVFRLPENVKAIVEQCLAQDPRPAYQDLPERVYGMEVAGVNVKFRVEQDTVWVLSVEHIVSD